MPFKLGSGNSQQAADEHLEFDEPSDGTTYPDGAERVEVAGNALTVAGHRFRATLQADVSGDGALDALAILQDDRGVPQLAVALADSEGLGALEIKHSLVEDESESRVCRVAHAQLRRLSKALVLAHLSLSCTEAAADAPAPSSKSAPPAPPEPGEVSSPAAAQTALAAMQLTTHDAIVRAEREVPLVERLRVQASDAIQLAARWDAQDFDGDGHTDLQLVLTTHGSDQEPIDSTLRLLDRPSGLALETQLAEKAWLALADEAKQLRKGQPERAYALALRVLTAHDALCRESGTSLVELSGARGLPCGPSLAAGRAATIWVAGLARKGHVRQACRLFEATQDAAVFALTSNDRERATYALAEQTLTPAWSAGPHVMLGAAPSLRRSALAFLDERRLLARETLGAFALDLTTAAREPAPTAADNAVITDPAGKRALVELVERCEGVRGKLVGAAQVVAGVVVGVPLAEPLLWPASATEHCEAGGSVPRALRPDVHALGWTEAGIVLAVDGALYSIAIEEAGAALTPQPLPDDQLARLREGALSTQARMLLTKTPQGLLRSPLGATRSTREKLIAYPQGLTQHSVTDLALSPSGQRVAVLAAGRVYHADLSAPAPPVEPVVPAASAPDTSTDAIKPASPPPAPPEPDAPR